MHRSAARITVLPAIALLTLVIPVASTAQLGPAGAASADERRATAVGSVTATPRSGTVRGAIVDASAAVLPGVSVQATAGDGRKLGLAFTDLRGEFVLHELPLGPVTLAFHLEGFEDATAETTVRATDALESGEPLVYRLALLGVTEMLTVRGDPPAPLPPPRPVLIPVPEHDQVSVCGPSRADAAVPSLGTIRSRRVDESKVLFAAGDELLIDGGADTGLSVGQNLVVRRRYPTALRYGRNRSLVVMGEHSSGLLQIVSVEAQVATAVVVYACDEMMRGDYLAPFEPEPVRRPDPAGRPAFDKAARILFADAGQPLGVTGRMMVIDRGATQDLRPGQRVTLFRRSRFSDARPIVIGEAVVVSVKTHSATIRVEQATDAVFFGDNGDWAAPHLPAQHAGN